MLKLDQYSDSILFQCDRCRQVGELFTEVVEDEGSFYCWGCLAEIRNREKGEVNLKTYAL